MTRVVELPVSEAITDCEVEADPETLTDRVDEAVEFELVVCVVDGLSLKEADTEAVEVEKGESVADCRGVMLTLPQILVEGDEELLLDAEVVSLADGALLIV